MRTNAKRKIRLMGAVVAGGLLLAACGGGGSNSSTSSTTTSTTSAASQTSSKAHWSYTVVASDKTTQTAVVAVLGGPQRYKPTVSADGLTASGACHFGSSDALFPAKILVTNTTKSSRAWIGVSLNAGSNFANWGWEIRFKTIAECGKPTSKSGGAGPLLVLSSTMLAPGASISVNAFFVIGDYYSSSNPNGDTSLLQSPIVITGKWAIPAKKVSTDSLAGPGATKVKSGSLAGSWTFALSGKTPAAP